MSDKAHFILKFRGFEDDPEEVATRLGIVPTHIWRIGDKLYEKSKRTYGDKGFRIEKVVTDLDSYDEELRDFICKHKDITSRIQLLPKGTLIELHCPIYTDYYNPQVYLEKETINILAQLGANLYVDVYCLPKDDEDDSE